jgi:hypothetical protein
MKDNNGKRVKSKTEVIRCAAFLSFGGRHPDDSHGWMSVSNGEDF